MCIYACERNSVFQLRLVKRVVHSSQKERERNRESMCVRHPDTLSEIVRMCEREMAMYMCTYALDREIYNTFVRTGRGIVHLRVKGGSTH